MLEFLSIVMLIFGILQIILFFKIWGMTNNVAELNRIIKNYINKITKDNQSEELPMNGIKIEDLVVELKTGRQMRVSNITTNGEYECKASGQIVGTFCRDEIELFDKYYNK